MPAPRVGIVLAAGLRTPQARAGGVFAQEDAAHLGASVARELLARTGIDPAAFDEFTAGCAGPPHDQANVGRVIALRSGLPRSTPARTVARNCASGMEAVSSAIAEIEAGHGELQLTVGVEVMSKFPLIVSETMTRLFAGLAAAKSAPQRLGVLAGFRPAMLKPRVAIMEGLTDPISGLIMGKTAELLAREWNVTREDADRYALESHRRAAAARDAGAFAREIVPHLPLGAKSGARALEHDDGIRDNQTMEGLAKLKPYFEKPDGRVTVGNACGLTDAACALVVTTEARARALGLAPLAKVRAWAWAACDPARMGLGPVYATAKALDAAKLSLAEIGAVELNEAFAAQVLACVKAFDSDEFAKKELGRSAKLGELDPDRLNKNGGAIALGHPVGCTGARLLLTAAHELARGDHEFTLATLCIGGGQGGAFVLERCA